MGSMERAKVKDSSHTNECTEEDRGSVLDGRNHKNDEILQRLGQVGVLEKVKKRQEEWKVRLEGMGNERCTKRVYKGVVDGKRPREEDPNCDGWTILDNIIYMDSFL